MPGWAMVDKAGNYDYIQDVDLTKGSEPWQQVTTTRSSD